MSVEQVSPEQGRNILTEFVIDGQRLPVSFVEHVIEPGMKGVESDIYEIDENRDLAIISFQAEAESPRQLILEGERTIEGRFSGRGRLFVTRANGDQEVHEFDDNSSEVTLYVGDIMKFKASEDLSPHFAASEVCINPRYRPSRFQNLS